jgi:threonine dehydrogenase-like Zn-dependent dehydrogenase
VSSGLVTRGYWVKSEGHGSIDTVALATPDAPYVHLRALCTGISAGTERMIGTGSAAALAHAPMAVPGMQGSFALPVLYGYSFVGEVVDGPRRGERAFTMRPHQQAALVPIDACRWLPAAVPSPRATLFPNLETAQNAVWDAELAPRERVVIVGGGAVGALLAFVLARQHGGEVAICEASPERRRQLTALPWVHQVLAPDQLQLGSFAIALHTSGTALGLQAAIDAVGFEGRVIDLSWYGQRPVSLQLGGAFHWQRKRIVSSQVGTVAASHRAHGRELRDAAVLHLLHDPALDALLAEAIAFDTLPAFFARLYRGEPTPLCPVVRYS